MKKVLFATTALVASAGIASAQGVSISGWAEMGIVGGSVYGDEVQFWTDVDIEFRMSGETDNGLTFGAGVDLDENNAFSGTTQGGEFIFISGAFGTLTMGDTDGAFDWALTEVGMGASIDDAHTSHWGYSGNSSFDGFGGKDGQVARYDYSFGDFAFAVSAELDDTGTYDPTLAIGAKYSTSFGSVDLGFGLAYVTSEDVNGTAEGIGGSVDVTFAGGFMAVVNYTSIDGLFYNPGGVGAREVDSHMAIGLGYTTGAISVSANYGVFTGVAADSDAMGYGLQAGYDLGGGAEIQFGYGYSEDQLTDTTADQFSLGVAMSF